MEIKNVILLVVFIFGLVCMQFIHGQSVDDIIDKYALKIGGKDKLNAISSIYMEGSRQMLGNEVAVKITRVQGKLFRNDFEIGKNSGYIIVTPYNGWSFIPMRLKKAQVMPEYRLATMQNEMDIAGPLIDYAGKGNTVKLDGEENINGQETYKLKLTLSNGTDIIYFIDTGTYLLVQTRQMKAAINENGEREVITNYANYKAVEGILFPHVISNPGEGLTAGSMVINVIELNKTIDENRYRPDISDY